MSEVLTKSFDEILTFFRQLKEEIVAWFKSNLKTFKNVEKVDDLLIVYIKILKSNRLYLKALDRVIEKRVLAKWLPDSADLQSVPTMKLNKYLLK